MAVPVPMAMPLAGMSVVFIAPVVRPRFPTAMGVIASAFVTSQQP